MNNSHNSGRNLEKAALRGEPSYVWQAGQARRLAMILKAADGRQQGMILENGCGVGMYVEHLSLSGGKVFGLEYDPERAIEAGVRNPGIINAAGEKLPYSSNTFDLILSHEVLEHVQDDKKAVTEMIRVLKKGGRAVIFVPNQGYPFETHGIYWKGKYHFGNKLFVNYLPKKIRDGLAPHVRVYSRADMDQLFSGLPVTMIETKVIFGAYDNIINRFGSLGKMMRTILQSFEKTPLSVFGLSHFWVVQKN